MITKFRKKLRNEGRTLKWFFMNYIGGDRSYTSFAQQVGGFVLVQKDVDEAIKKYMAE